MTYSIALNKQKIKNSAWLLVVNKNHTSGDMHYNLTLPQMKHFLAA